MSHNEIKAVERSRQIADCRCNVEKHSPDILPVFDAVASAFTSLLFAVLQIIVLLANQSRRQRSIERKLSENSKKQNESEI